MSTITPLPTPPSRSRPTQFSAETDAFLSALAAFVPEVNQVSGEVDANATTATTQAGIATNQAAAAAISAAAADASATIATASADIVEWVSGASFTEGSIVWSPLNYHTYRAKNNISGTTDPSLDPTNYERITTNGKMVRVERTSNTKLTSANIGNLIAAEGEFDQTFDSCENLGAGWWCIYQNDSTVYTISLNPDGSELIDGLTSFYMYPHEIRLIQCDGTTLSSIILNPFFFTSGTSFTFYKPPGYTAFDVEMWGAGGSGRKHSTASAKYGGGGGSCCVFRKLAALCADSNSATIGSGGDAITTDNTNGEDGSDTTFLGVTAYGGKGGTSASGAGGDAFYAASNNPSTQGGIETLYGGGSSSGSSTRASIYGATGGGYINASDAITAPAASVFGGQGGAGSLASNGADGSTPGGGGGPTKTGTQSGAGARGEIRVRGVI